jgi:hypothetical protein
MKFSIENNRLISIHKGIKDNINNWSLPEFWKTDRITDKNQRLISVVLSKDQKEFATLSK